ncbi:MAG: pentapeptide repeat-containing protein, partial [Deltaproteobacteria bacterium]|nr:pentapeptide repeat-containing protein [Deltaproteobacteria bacterium]
MGDCCKAGDYYSWCDDHDELHVDVSSGHYCIFHAPAEEKGVTLVEFNNLIFERINKAKIDEKLCKLSGTIYPGRIEFLQYNKSNPLPGIDFSGSTFSGQVFFAETVFSNSANFNDVIFSDYADFVKVCFSAEALFFAATFSGGVSFSSTFFSKGADFLAARFDDIAIFSKATFVKETLFLACVFSKIARFDSAIFEDKVSFSKAVFESALYFGRSNSEKSVFFGGEVRFDDVEFCGLTQFSYLNVSSSTWLCFLGARFTGSTEFSNISMPSRVLFARVNVTKDAVLRFTHVFFVGGISFEEAIIDGKLIMKSGKPEHNKAWLFEWSSFKVPQISDYNSENLLFGDEVDFTSMSITGIMRLEGALLNNVRFLHSDINHIDFVRCKFPKPQFIIRWYARWRLKKEELLLDELECCNIEESNVLQLEKKLDKTIDVEALYIGLKQRAVTDHDWHDASVWNFNEKDMTLQKNRLAS